MKSCKAPLAGIGGIACALSTKLYIITKLVLTMLSLVGLLAGAYVEEGSKITCGTELGDMFNGCISQTLIMSSEFWPGYTTSMNFAFTGTITKGLFWETTCPFTIGFAYDRVVGF